MTRQGRAESKPHSLGFREVFSPRDQQVIWSGLLLFFPQDTLEIILPSMFIQFL